MFRPRAAAKHTAFGLYVKESGVLTRSREELRIAVCTTFGSKKVPLYLVVYGIRWGDGASPILGGITGGGTADCMQNHVQRLYSIMIRL